MIRPSDAKSWTLCKRRVWLDNNPPEGLGVVTPEPFDQLIISMGIEHEKRVLDKLKEQYEVIEATSNLHTQELMQANVEVIYQPQFIWQDVIAKPDFLILHESKKYQAGDAKLARREEKKEIQIQLSIYRKILDNDLPALAYLGVTSQ